MQVGTRTITLAEYLSYGDQPVEVVDGQPVLTNPVHSRRESTTVANLLHTMSFVHEHRLGEVYAYAPYILDGDPGSKRISDLRLPDLSFISRDRVLAHDAEHPGEDEPWWLAPDLAVEVVSPTDLYSDVSQKVADYVHFGVRLVWVIAPARPGTTDTSLYPAPSGVDPAGKSVRVYSPSEPLGHSLGVNDKLTAEPVIDGWSMQVAELFADD